jgi:hypothetical protein
VVLLLLVVALWLAMGMLLNLAVVPGVSICTKLMVQQLLTLQGLVQSVRRIDHSVHTQFQQPRRKGCLSNGNMWGVSSKSLVLFPWGLNRTGLQASVY